MKCWMKSNHNYAGFEFEKTPIELMNYHEKCPA